MELKKINPQLQKALIEKGLETANLLQEDSWSYLKSGADCVLCCEKNSGKSVTIAMQAIQKLGKSEGESTRALILVKDKDSVAPMTELVRELAQYTDLRIMGVHEKGDIDYDKNQISLGLDILVGTPTKINELFASAGFNLNTIRFFAIDDADVVFKNRQDSIIHRLAESIQRTQFVFTCQEITERIEIIADKIMTEPLFYEEEEEDEEDFGV